MARHPSDGRVQETYKHARTRCAFRRRASTRIASEHGARASVTRRDHPIRGACRPRGPAQESRPRSGDACRGATRRSTNSARAIRWNRSRYERRSRSSNTMGRRPFPCGTTWCTAPGSSSRTRLGTECSVAVGTSDYKCLFRPRGAAEATPRERCRARVGRGRGFSRARGVLRRDGWRRGFSRALRTTDTQRVSRGRAPSALELQDRPGSEPGLLRRAVGDRLRVSPGREEWGRGFSRP